jgi:hypothetical protein
MNTKNAKEEKETRSIRTNLRQAVEAPHGGAARIRRRRWLRWRMAAEELGGQFSAEER